MLDVPDVIVASWIPIATPLSTLSGFSFPYFSYLKRIKEFSPRWIQSMVEKERQREKSFSIIVVQKGGESVVLRVTTCDDRRVGKKESVLFRKMIINALSSLECSEKREKKLSAAGKMSGYTLCVDYATCGGGSEVEKEVEKERERKRERD